MEREDNKSRKSWADVAEENLDKDATLCADRVEQEQTDLDHSDAIEVGDESYSSKDNEQELDSDRIDDEISIVRAKKKPHREATSSSESELEATPRVFKGEQVVTRIFVRMKNKREFISLKNQIRSKLSIELVENKDDWKEEKSFGFIQTRTPEGYKKVMSSSFADTYDLQQAVDQAWRLADDRCKIFVNGFGQISKAQVESLREYFLEQTGAKQITLPVT